MYSLLMIAGGAVEGSIGTFVAQNFGAKRFDRVQSGVRDGMKLSLAAVAVVMAITLPLARFILGLLIDGDPAQVASVLDVGTVQLTVMTLFLPLLYMLFLYRAALQGIGNTFIPMISGFVEMAMRLISVLLLTQVWGVWGIYLADSIGWPVAAVLLIISCHVFFRKLQRVRE